MFENDALDNTVSVARGPRETMKPRITEISPPSVETGKITLVMLKGANLVGAKVTTRVPGISLKTEVPRANSLGVILRVDQAVKPGPVQFEITTPIGAVAATVTVVPAQAPVTPGKPKGDAVKPGKPESCPEGMVAIASAAGGFCIDMNRTQEGDWFFVEQACSYNFKRLCWAEEWEQACCGPLPRTWSRRTTRCTPSCFAICWASGNGRAPRNMRVAVSDRVRLPRAKTGWRSYAEKMVAGPGTESRPETERAPDAAVNKVWG